MIKICDKATARFSDGLTRTSEKKTEGGISSDTKKPTREGRFFPIVKILFYRISDGWCGRHWLPKREGTRGAGRTVRTVSRYQPSRWMARPERSFGSNQVVFGGMMLPLSAMSISCFMETG